MGRKTDKLKGLIEERFNNKEFAKLLAESVKLWSDPNAKKLYKRGIKEELGYKPEKYGKGKQRGKIDKEEPKKDKTVKKSKAKEPESSDSSSDSSSSSEELPVKPTKKSRSKNRTDAKPKEEVTKAVAEPIVQPKAAEQITESNPIAQRTKVSKPGGWRESLNI
jgi:hypothetical protein